MEIWNTSALYVGGFVVWLINLLGVVAGILVIIYFLSPFKRKIVPILGVAFYVFLVIVNASILALPPVGYGLSAFGLLGWALVVLAIFRAPRVARKPSTV